ncbi:MAG: Gfo/Idh/MocA family oxidoreductase [Dehalococcoidia bacterium]
MPGDVVRYGIISTAQIALNRHVPAAAESANSEIVAVSSRSDEPAKQAAEKHGIPKWYGTYDELLADPDIDAVINPLPNSMHHEWTIKAAEAGKHILCEKPLAVTVQEAREMIDAARANNVVLVEAFTHRWNPHLRRARQLIAEGAIGKVTNLYSALTFNVAEPAGNVRFSKELAGGALMDAGCYAVYACRFAMSTEPVRAAGFAHDSGNWGVDTTFSGLLEFPGGAVAYTGTSMEQPRRCDLIALGTEGRIEIPDMFDDSGPVIVTIGDDKKTEATPAPNRFTVQFDEFSECVLTGKAPEFPAEDGTRNTAALVALLTAAREGKVVDVEQV